MNWQMIGKNLVRILVTCAIIVGIGAALVTLSPKPKNAGLGVEPARANIFWMTPASPTNTQKFTAALRDLGHEPPRSYTLNDNNVYFSTRLTHKSPESLLREYQQAFVESGLNSKMWVETTDSLMRKPATPARAKEISARAEAAMAGEVLPAGVSRDYLNMTGMLVTNPSDSQNEDQLLDKSVTIVEQSQARLASAYKQCNGDPAVLERARKNIAAKVPEKGSNAQKLDEALAGQTSCDGGGPVYCSELRARLSQGQDALKALGAAIDAQPEMKNCSGIKQYDAGTAELISKEMTTRVHAFRSLEAVRDAESGQTMVTASWSDEAFDMNSLLADEYPVARKDADEVPLCNSCKRTWSFDGTEDEGLYSAHSIWSKEPISAVATDYIQTLSADGWEYAEGDAILRQVLARIEAPDNDGGSILRFRRDTQYMTVRLSNDRRTRRTLVTVATTK